MSNARNLILNSSTGAMAAPQLLNPNGRAFLKICLPGAEDQIVGVAPSILERTTRRWRKTPRYWLLFLLKAGQRDLVDFPLLTSILGKLFSTHLFIDKLSMGNSGAVACRLL
jgi:hypothetical protein